MPRLGQFENNCTDFFLRILILLKITANILKSQSHNEHCSSKKILKHFKWFVPIYQTHKIP